MINQTKAMKERCIENHLRFYNTYLTGIKNCEQQLDYIMPSLVSACGTGENGSLFFIVNDTEKTAIDRIEGKRALDLREEIEHYKMIISSINNALEDLKEQELDFVKFRYFERLPIQEVKQKLKYSEDKSVYRVRRHVLDKLIISLNNLLILK
jgi:DNA-directed RNA polymerase specialized sigma subunit